jgi:fatty acid desaturase
MTGKLKQLESEFSAYRKLTPWNSIFDILISYLIIYLSIYLTLNISNWFYLLALVFIGSRQHALGLLGHEASHGILFANPKFNTFMGKYFCHYPVLVSHQRFKIQHLLHHRFLGGKQDPDLGFYFDYPQKKKVILKRIFWMSLTGQYIFTFAEYYNGFHIPLFSRRKFNLVGKSDHKELLTFWFILISILLYYKLFIYFFLFWFLPLFIWLPWIIFKVSLEHAPITISNSPFGNSRSIISYKWLEFLLFPLHINYHCEHHLFSWIPHYHLPNVAKKLRQLETNSEFSFLKFRRTNLHTGIQQLFR